MYKPILNKRSVLKFTHFSNRGYSLFAVLGKEVIIGVLSVATLQHATAHNVSNEALQTSSDSTVTNKQVMLDEVSVTGTRAPLTVSQQARMVTVLSREDIQAAPVQSVNDLLKYAVGVDVRQKGALGALTDVSIRGGNSEQITVLLNGINICDAQTAHNTFDFPVDISEIERIEVLEGPAGRVYGTSSLLGAINIVTKTPPSSSLSARVEGGSYGYLAAGARANIVQGRWNNQLSGSFTRSDGYLRNKANRLNADYKTSKAFYQGNYNDSQIAVRWHAGMSVKDFGANTFYAAKYDDQFEHTFKTFTALQAENKQGKFHIRPSIYWNRSMDRFELFRGAPQKYAYNYHRTDVYGVNLNAYFDWSLGRTAFGAELRHEELVSTNLGEKLEYPHHIHGTDRNYTNGINRTNLQFVLEHNIILSRFTLSAGVIAVKNSQADMNMRVYPGIDASYRMGNAWKVYASYNTSLRMPSFTELFYSVGGHKADKHLKPEELSALEAGLKYNARGISGKTSIFYNQQKNLIDWISDGTLDANGSPLWKSVNFGRINVVGVEASLRFDCRTLMPSQRFLKQFSLAYCYLNQNEKEHKGITSKYVLEYVKNKMVANLQLNLWRNLDLGLNYRLLHRMGGYIDTNNQRHNYATYGILDTRLSWNTGKWTAFAAANNLLNRTYVDYGNVPQPGTWITAGVSIQM
ncbi:outer membrane vitamin B12 receptor BtuB [Prevotella intermedia]|uniref:Outer membrane vitamin B12 receptor BtuB n=1 Tax=Prevotella intermedia TaxID=28131 RepID=A0AAD1BH42_PREIN|nr:TonB-dependent receptor [Prevotella intermedia]AFJ07973.1 TonB-dependent receptor [Prevotella intermedia 17]APW34744.1 peptidase [Prevotella intermedia]BAR95529.1 outer membrane vitamin B12 receptor BtuB [Prevotella intermedia]